MATLLACAVTAWAPAPTVTSAPIVQTTNGSISGVSSSDGVTAFYGVPFAAPPLGALRFQPPKAHEGWSGVRPMTKPG
eukprot:1537536-Prymnesium_polylepis.1